MKVIVVILFVVLALGACSAATSTVTENWDNPLFGNATDSDGAAGAAAGDGSSGDGSGTGTAQ